MKHKQNHSLKSISGSIFIGLLLVGMIAGIMLPDKQVSETERRTLTQFPGISIEQLLDNDYSNKLETYLLEQFPLRNLFRTMKAQFDISILGKTDSNGYVKIENHLFKIQTTYDEGQVYQAGEIFADIVARYFADANVYYSVIPDKDYYVEGLPTYDYEATCLILENTLVGGTQIDVADIVTLDDYYDTDLHLKQEAIVPLANHLLNEMECEIEENYDVVLATDEFYGGYAGNSAYLVEPDVLYYLENEVIQSAIVYDYESKAVCDIYQLEKLDGMDGYDIFLGGARALLTISNEQKESGKRLIVFRDSFGSSIAPLLLSGYEEITLVDLRYVSAQYALSLLEDNPYDDVLFLYQVEVLYNSNSLKK